VLADDRVVLAAWLQRLVAGGQPPPLLVAVPQSPGPDDEGVDTWWHRMPAAKRDHIYQRFDEFNDRKGQALFADVRAGSRQALYELDEHLASHYVVVADEYWPRGSPRHRLDRPGGAGAIAGNYVGRSPQRADEPAVPALEAIASPGRRPAVDAGSDIGSDAGSSWSGHAARGSPAGAAAEEARSSADAPWATHHDDWQAALETVYARNNAAKAAYRRRHGPVRPATAVAADPVAAVAADPVSPPPPAGPSRRERLAGARVRFAPPPQAEPLQATPGTDAAAVLSPAPQRKSRPERETPDNARLHQEALKLAGRLHEYAGWDPAGMARAQLLRRLPAEVLDPAVPLDAATVREALDLQRMFQDPGASATGWLDMLVDDKKRQLARPLTDDERIKVKELALYPAYSRQRDEAELLGEAPPRLPRDLAGRVAGPGVQVEAPPGGLSPGELAQVTEALGPNGGRALRRLAARAGRVTPQTRADRQQRLLHGRPHELQGQRLDDFRALVQQDVDAIAAVLGRVVDPAPGGADPDRIALQAAALLLAGLESGEIGTRLLDADRAVMREVLVEMIGGPPVPQPRPRPGGPLR
jgi:hypothetical protein